jgi:hypothetical protein
MTFLQALEYADNGFHIQVDRIGDPFCCRVANTAETVEDDVVGIGLGDERQTNFAF